MAHHLLPEIERSWLDQLVHCFLIRDPKEVLLSLSKVTPNPRMADTGLPQQLEIFDRVRERTGTTPPILDARDVLDDPRGTLSRLCESIAVPFNDAMLSWPAGPRVTDGVWARYWYAAVEKSTTFEPNRPRNEELPARLAGLCEDCRPYYARMHALRL